MSRLTIPQLNRRCFGIGAVIIAGLLGFSAYQQFVLGLDPCPLCVFQRLAFAVIGLVCLVAVAHAPRAPFGMVYGLLVAVSAGVGAGIAGRHVWLQHLPADQVPACGPGLDYMLEVFPLTEAIRMVLGGSGECAEVQWQFLGLGIPAWALVWFVLLGLGALGWTWFLWRNRTGGA
ncbi:MAG: disulfide bond formation protein B [Pseudomonadota bacterium]|nr:disulfide bond formation protein B [Pseudomonadota bacterium]